MKISKIHLGNKMEIQTVFVIAAIEFFINLMEEKCLYPFEKRAQCEHYQNGNEMLKRKRQCDNKMNAAVCSVYLSSIQIDSFIPLDSLEFRK